MIEYQSILINIERFQISGFRLTQIVVVCFGNIKITPNTSKHNLALRAGDPGTCDSVFVQPF